MGKEMGEGKEDSKSIGTGNRRIQISQTDVPGTSLEQAIRVPRTIAEHYAGGSVTPLQLAAGLNMTPTSGPFRMLCGASIAYGLTEGGCNAKEISLTPLGKQIVKPEAEGDDFQAKREATLRPRVMSEFLSKYNGSSLPRTDIARNVLESMNVPASRSESVFNLIVESAKAVGFIRSIKDKQYVELNGTTSSRVEANDGDSVEAEFASELESLKTSSSSSPDLHRAETVINPAGSNQALPREDDERLRKVFITHGRDHNLIEPIKKLLQFGELIPVVSVQRETVSKPLPEKVMDDMRSCGAAIIHVADEARLVDETGQVRIVLNENVLIEIGAAMALYKDRFILLVKKGLELPSNLQGLYQVRYEGDTLDVHGTIQLMEAINAMKNHTPRVPAASNTSESN
jgi:predicted nucleotide-binding protein